MVRYKNSCVTAWLGNKNGHQNWLGKTFIHARKHFSSAPTMAINNDCALKGVKLTFSWYEIGDTDLRIIFVGNKVNFSKALTVLQAVSLI